MTFEKYWNSLAYGPDDDPTLVMHCHHVAKGAWESAVLAERNACKAAIRAIDDGEAPEYMACLEVIADRDAL